MHAHRHIRSWATSTEPLWVTVVMDAVSDWPRLLKARRPSGASVMSAPPQLGLNHSCFRWSFPVLINECAAKMKFKKKEKVCAPLWPDAVTAHFWALLHNSTINQSWCSSFYCFLRARDETTLHQHVKGNLWRENKQVCSEKPSTKYLQPGEQTDLLAHWRGEHNTGNT